MDCGVILAMPTRTMQDVFRSEREAWLEDARAVAHRMIEERGAPVTIEDVLQECPKPSYIHRNAVGAVFRSPAFKAVGWAPSRRTAMNGRYVRKWSLKGV